MCSCYIPVAFGFKIPIFRGKVSPNNLSIYPLIYLFIYIGIFDKLIWHTIGSKGFLFGTAQFSLWAVMIILSLYNSINYLLIGSRCIPNGTHTNHLKEEVDWRVWTIMSGNY